MPLIGIIPAVDGEKTTSVLFSYIHSIEQAGGTPVVLPFVEKENTLLPLLEYCDGFLFVGGADISPERYGEDPLPTCGTPSASFDVHGFRIFSQVYPTKKPILGICRGAQMINVALGGTLYQDLPTQRPSPIFHVQKEGKYEFSHEVVLTENQPLHTLLGQRRIHANSFHHQAVKALGKGLAVMANADDGTVEAIYAPDHPYLFGIQWHPERLIDTDGNSRALFAHFIRKCEDLKEGS